MTGGGWSACACSSRNPATKPPHAGAVYGCGDTDSRRRGISRSGCRFERGRTARAHLADPVVELQPAVVEPRDHCVAIARYVGGREAPELQPDGRSEQAAGPDVADVLEAFEADVAEDHHVGLG